MEWRDVFRFLIILMVVIIVDVTYRYFRGVGITYEGLITLAVGATVLAAIREKK